MDHVEKSKANVTHQFIATCPNECKRALSQELLSLGAIDVKSQKRSVLFEASWESAYKILLKSAVASRVYLKIKQVNAKQMNFMQSKLSRSNLESYFKKDTTFKIDIYENCPEEIRIGKNQLSKTVRLAIEDRFHFLKLPQPRVDIKEPDVTFVGFYNGVDFILSVDLCGRSLHKRGFRKFNHLAPIKETLAAAIFRQALITKPQCIYDPFCGGGTMIIEAAYQALNKSVSIHRKKGSFDMENMSIFDKDLWRSTAEKLRNEMHPEPEFKLYASDLDSECVEGAKENALAARVEKHIEIFTKDFFESTPPEEKGVLVCNLPYDERIKQQDAFYKNLGDHLKKNYKGWKAFLLMPGSAGSIGLKPNSKTNFKNGSLQVKLCEYDLF